MKILLHGGENHELKSRLRTQIQDVFPQGELVLTHALGDLTDALCRPLHNISVLIAFITDSKSIDMLFSLKPLLENVKLILIFCQQVGDVQKSVLRLEPLYAGCFEDDFQDIISVLQRIEYKRMAARKPV